MGTEKEQDHSVRPPVRPSVRLSVRLSARVPARTPPARPPEIAATSHCCGESSATREKHPGGIQMYKFLLLQQ